MAPIGNNQFLTDLDVRIWLRDNDPAANLLLDDLEFTPEEIRTCMTLTVDYWNDQPPNIGSMDYNKFPWRSKLLLGTCANLMFAAGFRFRRNSLQAQAGGVGQDEQNKYKQYDEAGTRMWQEYKDWVVIQKRAVNIERGWAIVH